MKKILVAVDGSEKSKKALGKAREIGELSNSDITVITVINTFGSPYITDPEIKVKLSKENVEYGENILKDATQVLEGYSGAVHTMLRDGDIGGEIMEEAEEGDYDLVVMGSRGLGAFSRTFLGSVSNRVVNHINKSILIVK
ncbi:MAG: universal stress protein [Tissierellia bacterium]|nr:universal stress protein [Tissierellia bacterium]